MIKHPKSLSMSESATRYPPPKHSPQEVDGNERYASSKNHDQISLGYRLYLAHPQARHSNDWPQSSRPLA